MPVVTLLPVEDGDLPLFFEWQADEESSRLAAVATRDVEVFAAHWSRIRSDAETTLRTVVADGAVAGNALSWTGDDGRMVGYWLGKAYWGGGSQARRSHSFSKTSGTDPCSRPSPSTTRARAGRWRRSASSA